MQELSAARVPDEKAVARDPSGEHGDVQPLIIANVESVRRLVIIQRVTWHPRSAPLDRERKRRQQRAVRCKVRCSALSIPSPWSASSSSSAVDALYRPAPDHLLTARSPSASLLGSMDQMFLPLRTGQAEDARRRSVASRTKRAGVAAGALKHLDPVGVGIIAAEVGK